MGSGFRVCRMVLQPQARLVGLVHSFDQNCRPVLPHDREAERVGRAHLCVCVCVCVSEVVCECECV